MFLFGVCVAGTALGGIIDHQRTVGYLARAVATTDNYARDAGPIYHYLDEFALQLFLWSGLLLLAVVVLILTSGAASRCQPVRLSRYVPPIPPSLLAITILLLTMLGGAF